MNTLRPLPGPAPVPLIDQALLADGERGAVLDPHGAITWLCVPQWHDEPAFAALVGGRGEYTVTPDDRWHVWGGYDEPGTLVRHSRWINGDGLIECEEALALPAHRDRLTLLRRIRAVDGEAALRVVLEPVTGFDGEPVRFHAAEGVWTGKAENLTARLTGLPDAVTVGPGRLEAELALAPGEHHDLVLEITRGRLLEDPPDPEDAWTRTRSTWHDTVPDLAGWRAAEELRRSYAVLAGLTSIDHGMVAAATMALPERARAGRNYDYRYAWIRDQCYVGTAVAALGHLPLLDSALTFVAERILADGDQLKPAYRVDGSPVPDERHVGLPGYPGGGDVVGNWVNQQFQLDALGEALSMFAAADAVGALTDRHRHAVHAAVAVIDKRWTEPEAGIWELGNDHYAQSRLACVAGLRAMAARVDPATGTDWTVLAEEILAATSGGMRHPDGWFQQTPDNDTVDASCLLPIVRGALPVDDPRARATRQAVADQLTVGGHVYRFRHEGLPLGQAEGSFTLCGFMAAMAWQAAGEPAYAMHLFERARAACTAGGLFTEEYDTSQRQLRGNFPQAFVHALFIEAATRLDHGFEPQRAND